jgi:holo-[acyl-carrier protein] synthase
VDGGSTSVVVGIGLDIVEIERVGSALRRHGERFVRRLMDEEEAGRLPAEPDARALALALAVAGKEAASKALGTGWSDGVAWRQVVVEAGPPSAITLVGRAAEVARRRGSAGRVRARVYRDGAMAVAEALLLS